MGEMKGDRELCTAAVARIEAILSRGNSNKEDWMCSTPVCQKPSWNRNPGEYCSRACRNSDRYWQVMTILAGKTSLQDIDINTDDAIDHWLKTIGIPDAVRRD